VDSKWLSTSEGRAWLESDEGKRWLVSPEGVDWSENTAAGREWWESKWNSGYDDLIAGRTPTPPDWALSPESAPRVGARVRFREDVEAATGVQFTKGELAIVVEARLAPIGCIVLIVRTLDGRRMMTTHRATLEPA
jgi:hypothetical protein